jgi:hypothetical protein
MAYQIPITQPLTETQAELVSKIGSMKNLMKLDFLQKFNIPKNEQISTFDYIIRIMRTMGIDPVILLKSFLSYFLSTNKLIEFILRANAQLLVGMKINLDMTSNIILNDNSSKDEKKQVVEINYNTLNSNFLLKTALITTVEALKMQIIKDLMLLIFGNPKKQSGVSTMTQDQESGRLDELINEAYCGTEVFSVYSPSNNRNEDLEYNRISLKERLKKGNAFFRVTCEGVDVSMPDDPSFLFSEAPPGIISLSSTTPFQALTNCIDYIGNQTQKLSVGSGEGKSSSNKESFSQKLVEKLVVHIAILLKPIFMGINIPSTSYNGLLKETQNVLFLQNRSVEANIYDPLTLYPPSSCEMLSNWDSDPNNWDASQKKSSLILTILCNMALNAVISYLMTYLLRKVREFITNYLAKRAVNKAKRKMDKLKQKLNGASGADVALKNASKVKKQSQLLKTIQPAINTNSNTFV